MVISVISSTAVANEDYQVYDISSAFSDMLRYILTDPSESVSLFTEIQHCRSYLSIMKYRYDYRYAVCSKWWILYFDAFLYLGLSENSNQMCKMLKATYAAQTITKERNETSRMY